MTKKPIGTPTFDEPAGAPVEHMETATPFAMQTFAATANDDVMAPDVTDSSGLLSLQEIASIEAEVKASVLKGKKKTARKALMEKLLIANMAETEASQEKVSITIGAPEFAVIDPANSGIRINGKSYIQGRVYTVARAVAEVLRETMQRAWYHEEVTKGYKNPNAYRRPSNVNEHGVPVSSGLVRF